MNRGVVIGMVIAALAVLIVWVVGYAMSDHGASLGMGGSG